MRVAVLVSGGVDSSVALQLLRAAGHDLTAFYLKVWLEDELDFLGECPWEEDLKYARAVCDQLSVPLEVVPLQQAYRERIISYTLADIRRGRTPNPDVLCNNRIKFGAFYDAVGHGFDRIASGHYARVEDHHGKVRLMQAPDPVKDQTYFLSHLGQSELGHALFPIGHLTKNEVRAAAVKLSLPTMARKDSQGLCFLGKISFRDFIAYHMGTQSGEFVDVETGKVIGEHKGSWFYTNGQRKGLGLSGGPWYVVSKEPATNRVLISRNYYHPENKRNEFVAEDLSLVRADRLEPGHYSTKVRHGPHSVGAFWSPMSDGRWLVQLDGNDQGLAPGQFAALYRDGECLGSAIIAEAAMGHGADRSGAVLSTAGAPRGAGTSTASAQGPGTPALVRPASPEVSAANALDADRPHG